MQCERARDLLGAFGDGELSAADREAMHAHVAQCHDCAERLGDYRNLGRAIGMEGREAMPAGLQARVMRALDADDATAGRADDSALLPGAPPVVRRPFPQLGARRWFLQAAALVLCCGLSAGAGWRLAVRETAADRLAQDLLNAHVRSLLQDSPVQVVSSEQHTVRPWFAGKTDIAPPVRDFSADGFPLVGGRLDYVDGHRASVLVYKRRLHTINVFLWRTGDEPADVPPSSFSRNGYSLLGLRRGGMTIWLVSDTGADELQQLAALL